MNINKLATQTTDMAEIGTRKLASAVGDVVSKATRQVEHDAQEIAGNYGKAITQLASNTVAEGEKELSALEKIFARLENKEKKVIKFADDSDEMEVLLFQGKHNDYIKSRDGKIYRIRYSKDDELNKTLVGVADTYAKGGIKVPKMFTVNIDGKRGVASQLMTDLIPKETNPKACYKLFGLDVIFGFRNAYSKGTTMLNHEGEVVRISTSGSAGYRVRGEKRPDFTGELTELRTFLDPNVNPESAEFLKGMTREDLLDSIVFASKERIGYPYSEVIRNRSHNLQEFWMRATLTPQKEGESLLEYVTRVQDVVKETHRENTQYSQKLREIIESYPTDGKYTWGEGEFSDSDKELCKKFIDKIENANDIPKAIYNRHFSRKEMLELAKMEMEEKKDVHHTSRKFVHLTDDPEIHARVIYSPERTVQATLDELDIFSRDYCKKRCDLLDGEPGRRSILEQGLLDKYSKGEISFNELHCLSDIAYDNWEMINKRKLLQPIAGRKTALNGDMIRTLAVMSDENFEKILSRPELLQDMPYRSEPLTGEYLYEILRLNDEEYSRMLRYHLLEDKYPGDIKRLFDKLCIAYLPKMSDEELDTAIKRGLLKHINALEPGKGCGNWNSQLNSSEIAQLAKLPDEQFNNLIERGLLSGKYDSYARETMIKTADFTQSDLDILNIYGIKSDFSHGSWNSGQLIRILKLSNKHRIRELERINPNHPTKTSFGSPDKLLDRDEIIKFAELPEEAYQKAVSIMKNEKLLNGVFKDGGVYEASLLDEKGWETIRKRGLLDVENPRYAHLTELTRGYVSEELHKLYPNDSALTMLSKISDETWEKFIQHGLISTNPNKGQLSGVDLFRISKFSDEEFEKLIKTKIFDVEHYPEKHHGYNFDNYHYFNNLEEIVKNLTTEEIETLAKHNFFTMEIENSYDALYNHFAIEDLKDAVKFTDKQFENFEKLLADKNNNGNTWLALQVVKRFKSDIEMQRILGRGLQYYCTAYSGIDGGMEKLINMTALVKLTDKEWEFVKPLMWDGLGDMRFLGSISKAITPGKGICHLVEFVNGRKNIYEFLFKERRELLNHLIHSGGAECRSGLIPEGTIIPRTLYRRNLLINELIESIGMSSKKLTEEERKAFFESLGQMSSKDSGIMSTNFDLMSTKLSDKVPSPKLLYSKEKFVNDIYEQIKDLPEIEQKQIFNYFSFDIEKDAQGKLILSGYPDPVGKVSKLGEWEEEGTKRIIDKLRPFVEKFTNGNRVFVEGNPKLEAELNKIIEVFPEFLTTIGKIQHDTHDFTVDIHTLKVLQSVMSDSRYAKLSDKDKVIMQISTILHDLTKAEKTVNKAHPKESAFDAYYMLKRLNLSREDKLKVYEIIRNHDWLERLNGKNKVSEHEYRHLTPEEYKTRLQEIAFAHRQNDCFEMASILAKADLKGVKQGYEFYNKFKDAYDKHENEVQKLIAKIKETSIHIPQTRVPKASKIFIDNEIAQEVTYDGIKNVVINMKPGQDLSKIGFDEGVLSDEFNAIVHALDVEEQATVFRALGIVDSDALLSSSWVNYGKGNYKVFRGQGFVLSVDSDDIHAGKYCDFGSGYKKDYETLLSEYIFGHQRTDVRRYWSDTIKEKFELSNEDYRKFYESIKNKPFNVIKSEKPEVAKKLQEIIDDMDVKRRAGGRNYNEWLVSRPEIQAGFFWGKNSEGKAKSIKDVPVFIREYCAENNIPIIFFGE